jgi:NodT family efflux transporter outer membrane factor (OMF) lipoprotein
MSLAVSRAVSRAAPLAPMALAMALLALTGCRAGPTYHAPALPSGAAGSLVSLNPAVESTAAPPDAWWRLYEDPRLDALVREALGANRTLAAADANFAAARSIVAAARASLYPSTGEVAQGLYGRDALTDEILELQGQRPQTVWLLEDVFQAAYEVDLFGRVHRAIEAANADADALAAARDSVAVEVAARTARSYAAFCALGEQLEVARHSLEVVAHEADITVKRHEAGANSTYDVARAQALVAQVRSGIPTLEGQRRAAYLELTALLGRAPAQGPKDLEQCVRPPLLSALMPVGDGSALLRRRPDVRQAERRLAAATAEIGVATADLYPRIRLLGLYGGAATQLPELNNNTGRTWGLGPSVSWSFPNLEGPRARVRQAKATQVAALASFDGVVLAALEETEQALALYSAALESREALSLAQARVHAAFDMVHGQFLAGSASNLDLLTTEQSLVAIDAQLAAADAALVADQIAVFKALGGGWAGTRGGTAP